MKKHFAFLLLSLSFVQFSFAHSPFLSCEILKEDINCIGSFSDGSSTFGVRIVVLDYNDEILSEGQLDKNNKISFPKPNEEEYYVKFDGGEGHEFEVDCADIKEGALEKDQKKEEKKPEDDKVKDGKTEEKAS